MCLAFAATHGCIDLRLRVANIGLSDDGACEDYEGFRELGFTSIAPYCTLHTAKSQAFFWTLSPTILLPKTRTKNTPHGPTSTPSPRRCRLMPFPMLWEHHWTSAAWDVVQFSGSLTHFISWSKSDIHLRSFGDSSWFIITLPIHMEQPSVSLDNGWCVVSTQKKPKYERYSTARERRALTCPAWPCRSNYQELPRYPPNKKSVPFPGQNNPQENPSSFWSGQTKSKRSNENKDGKCVIQRLIS